MSISKRKDWKPGGFAFAFKIIYPDGAVIECDCPHVSREHGDKVMATLSPILWGDGKDEKGHTNSTPEVKHE